MIECTCTWSERQVSLCTVVSMIAVLKSVLSVAKEEVVVTLGTAGVEVIVSGVVFVAAVYWFCFHDNDILKISYH